MTKRKPAAVKPDGMSPAAKLLLKNALEQPKGLPLPRKAEKDAAVELQGLGLCSLNDACSRAILTTAGVFAACQL